MNIEDIEFIETYTEYEEIDDLSALEDNDVPQTEEPIQEGVFPQPLYQLKLEYSQETFYATTTELNLQSGNYVITPTRYGEDIRKRYRYGYSESNGGRLSPCGRKHRKRKCGKRSF